MACEAGGKDWVPAFAGMTPGGTMILGGYFFNCHPRAGGDPALTCGAGGKDWVPAFAGMTTGGDDTGEGDDTFCGDGTGGWFWRAFPPSHQPCPFHRRPHEIGEQRVRDDVGALHPLFQVINHRDGP